MDEEFNDPEQEQVEKEEPKKVVKKPKENKSLVVSQLPTQNVTTASIGDEEYDLVTTEDALTEILEKVRRLDKVL